MPLKSTDHFSETKAFDILIIGAGLPSLSLVLGLVQRFAGELRIGIVDPLLAPFIKSLDVHKGNKAHNAGLQQASPSATPQKIDGRASTLTPYAYAFLQSLDPALNEALAKAEPVLQMKISDTPLEEPIRPFQLEFQAEDQTPLAYVMDNALLRAHLTDALRRAHKIHANALQFIASSVKNQETGRTVFHADNKIAGNKVVVLENGERLSARLIIAADGANSRLRTQAGIPFYGKDYGQKAFVATLEHEYAHEGAAVQHFLPSGPFAVLPLPSLAGDMGTDGQQALRHFSSLVWSETETTGARAHALEYEEALIEALQKRLTGMFGKILGVHARACYPLKMGLARDYVQEGFVLLGDAAHVIHPLAGQGLNLALGDVKTLIETLEAAFEGGMDFASLLALRPYEQARKAEAGRMAATTNGLNRLFSNDHGLLRHVRLAGLSFVNHHEGLKQLMIKEATGKMRV